MHLPRAAAAQSHLHTSYALPVRVQETSTLLLLLLTTHPTPLVAEHLCGGGASRFHAKPCGTPNTSVAEEPGSGPKHMSFLPNEHMYTCSFFSANPYRTSSTSVVEVLRRVCWCIAAFANSALLRHL